MSIHAKIQNAKLFKEWITSRGGIAVWTSVNLSDPGREVLTPAFQEDGTPYPKPSWWCSDKPSEIVTDPNQVKLSQDIEVKRFHVGVRTGSQGMSLKVTDGGSRRIRAAVEKAGDGSYHEFDYDTQEAVIMKPDKTITLAEFQG